MASFPKSPLAPHALPGNRRWSACRPLSFCLVGLSVFLALSLPSRLYARNFGGELKLKRSASGEGTNATLQLSRRGTRLEPLVWPKAPDSIEELYAHVHL